VNDELEKMLKEAVVVYFKALSQHFPGGTEENHENVINDSRSPGQDFYLGPSEEEAGVLVNHSIISLKSGKFLRSQRKGENSC
jgi:hypothetical protein